MACHYHPERESTDTCAICGKEVCKECSLEIAGKIYCKDCLEKIIGVESEETVSNEPVEETIPPEQETSSEPINIYSPQEEVIYEEEIVSEPQKINADSPYNIRDSIQYDGGLESSYLHEDEKPQPAEFTEEEIVNKIDNEPDEFIYPDHSYEPEKTSARLDLEDKYEKYLDDLYFDETEVSLEEQLAKDEEQYGSLTKKPYTPPEKPAVEQKIAEPKKSREPARPETPEEMEARIRAEILKEQGKEVKDIDTVGEKSIHNLNYQEEKEPMGIIDIVLTVILVIVILIVIYYLLYLFILNSSYPTFIDAVYGLKNPQNVINNVLSNV